MEVKRKSENSSISSTSSPPTPPSPLPISVGPGNQKYYFSPSPSPSPPFSPPTSRHSSAELLPLILQEKLPSPRVPAAFSLDRSVPEYSDSTSSCLKDLLEWFIERCCNACSTTTTTTTTKRTRNLLSNDTL